MKDQSYIEFRKKRYLGDIITDTFKFLQSEWKPFLGTIIKTAIVPILIAICAVVYYVMSSTSFFGGFSTTYYDEFSDVNFSQLLLPLLAFAVAYLIAYALIGVSALSYIKSYTTNRGIVNFEKVSNETKEKFGSSVGLFFLNGLIIGFGSLLCFLPGIYFGVVLSLSICLLVFQNKGVTESINDSFGFIKGNWWETFGVMIVVGILTGVISFIAGIPASVYQLGDIFGGLNEDPAELMNTFSDPIYLTLLVFSYFVNFILHMVTVVTTAFIYYDIKEQHDPTTHTDFIDEIGVE